MDPASDNNNNAPLILNQVYEPLVWFDKATTNLIPWLAESYNVSSDGLTYTFNLRKGITFHDGTAFNAQAVKFTLDRTVLINDPASAVPYLNGHLVGAATYAASKKTSTDAQAYLANNAVEVVDDYTVNIHLASPDPVFPNYLTATDCFIVSPTWVNAHGGVTPGQPNTQMQQSPGQAGTGPFILTSWDAQAQSAVLTRNANYWGTPYGTGPAQLKTVIIKIIANENTRLLDLQAGGCDLTYLSPNVGLPQIIDMPTWLNSGTIKVTAPGVAFRGPFPTLSVRYLAMCQNTKDTSGNPLPSQPFANKLIRQAMSLAFDHATYLSATYNNFAIQPNGCVAKGCFGYDPTIPLATQNLDQAKQLLNQAAQTLGFSPSNPLNVPIYYFTGSANGKNASTILASAVNGLNTGFNLQVNTMPAGAFFTAGNNSQLPAWVLGWPANFPDASEDVVAFGDPRLGPGSSIAVRAQYNDPAVVSLIDQQAVEQDPTKRASLISQIVNDINNDYAYIWLDQPSDYFTVRDNVQGWSVSSSPNIVLSNHTAGLVYLYPVYRQ